MMRAAGIAALLLALAAPARATPPNLVTAAEFAEPTTRYDHGVLGDAVEWGALRITANMCPGCDEERFRTFTIRLPENRVFEDVAPRLVQLNGNPFPAVMVVETDVDLGARLAIYAEFGLLAATPFIGTTHRWLAPVGVADLDGDGWSEIAYVDRPHLLKTLRIWRYDGGDGMTEIASAPGYSNHRIGDDYISGGVRACDGAPEFVTASGDWKRILASTLRDGRIVSRDLGPYTGAQSMADAMSCGG